MQIKISAVDRDEAGKVSKESVVDTHAALVDKAQAIAEVIPTDTVGIEAIFWNRKDGIFQVHLSFGGVDSKGNYHANPDYKLVSEVWGRERTPALWAKYNLDNILALDWDKVLEWLLDEYSFRFILRDKWSIPAADAKLVDDDGEVVKDYKPRPIVKAPIEIKTSETTAE